MSTVHVIILNYRTAEMTLKAAQTAIIAMEGIAGAITIVDNDSQDGSFETMAQAAADWPRVRVLQSGRNGGYGAGNNFGISAGLPDGSRADFVYILNSDAFPAPDAIRVLLDYLHSHPGTGFAGSYIHGPDGAAHGTAFRFPSIASEFEGSICLGLVTRWLKDRVVTMDLPQHTQPVDWLAGASVLMRMETLDQIGLFDETFFLYFEETELCFRAARAGWQTVYVRESHVEHIGSVSTGMKTWRRMPRYWFDSRRYYFEKTHGRAYAAAATLAHMGGLAIWRLRATLQRKDNQDPPYFFRDFLKHSLMTRTSRRV